MAGLAIKIGGDTRGFSSALNTARNLALRNSTEIATTFTGAAAKIDGAFAKTALNIGQQFGKQISAAAMPSLATLALGVAGFEALKFAIGATADAAKAGQERLEELLKIGAKAKDLGVGTTFFQGLTGQAKELGTEASKLTAMLDQAREAATQRIAEGKDELVSSAIEKRLQQNVAAGNLPQSALDRYTAAGDQEQRIRAILDLVEELQRAGKQLAAFDLGRTFFGADFEQQLRNGVNIVGAMRTALDGMKTAGGSRIIPPEEIETARQINEQLERARAIMADGLRPIQEDMAQWQLTQAAGYANLVELTAQWVAGLGSVYARLQDVGNYIEKLGNASIWGKIYDLANGIGLGGMNGVVDLTDEDRRKAREAKEGTVPLPAITVPRDRSRSLPSLSVPKAKAPKTAETTEKSQVETYINGLERSTAALKAEFDALGKSNVERLQAINLAKAEELAKQNNIKLSEQEIARIKETSKATAEYKDQLEDARDKQEFLRSTGTSVLQGIASDFRNGVTGGQAFLNVLDRIASKLLDMEINNLIDAAFGKAGTGGGGSLTSLFSGGLGSLFGGGATSNFAGHAADAVGPFLPASVHHTGGIVGLDGLSRRKLPASIVNTAPRFHSGLTGREFPAVLEAGERVLTERMARSTTQTIAGLTAATAGAPGGGKPELHIHAADRTEVQQSQGPQGIRTDVFLDKKVAAALTGGPNTRSALKQISGARLVGK